MTTDGPSATTGVRTTSLRLRVTVGVLLLLAVMLVVVGVLIDLVLGAQLRGDVQQRLLDRAGYARILAEQGTDPQDLADRLTGDGISATYRVDGTTLYGQERPVAGKPARLPAPRPRPPAPAGLAVERSGDVIQVTQTVAGGTLTVSTSQAGTDQALARLRRIELVAGAATIVVTGLLLTRVVAVALRPLRRMTELAVGISRGGRGGRLRAGNPRTELGRVSSAFDDMLQALESAEDDARSAAAEAAAGEGRMRRLLDDVSHELRTPFAGLQASAETLLRDDPARPQREQLALGMVRETHRAARLLNDLLLMTRLERAADDGSHLVAQPVDLSALADAIGAQQRLLAAQVHVDVRADPDVWVRADPERLAQMITNLMDNARHATPPGGRITLRVRDLDGSAEVEVADTGPGVPADQRDTIFGRFVRLDPARSRQHGGSGLGLPIARALAAAHGGTLVCAESRVGARFLLRLPSRPAPDRVGVPSPVRGPDGAPQRCLESTP